MESAVIRVWELPELVKMVLSYSSKHSIARIMRINRTLYALAPVVLYHTICDYEARRMLTGSAGISGLVKYANYVRSISLPREFCDRYIIDAIDSENVFPPLLNLTTFSCDFTRRHGSTNAQSNTNISNREYLVSIARTLRSSTRLASLILGQVLIYHQDDIDPLCRTISGLKVLQTVECTMLILDAGLDDEVVSKVFFSLPQSVKTASVVATSRFSRNEMDARATLGDRRASELPRRQDPLRNLTSWRAQFPNGLGADTVIDMAERCPQLVTLEVPVLRRGQDEEDVAQRIVDCCPKLVHLTLHFDSNIDTCTSMMTEIIQAMPEDTLQSMFVEGYHDHDTALADSIKRHYGSLSKIEFEETGYFDGYILQTILNGCRVLEVLSIDGRRSECLEVPLKDVLLYKWASKALRTLQFSVQFPNMRELNAMKVPDGSTSKYGVITEEQKKGNTPLGKLYRKIRFLENLENLQLHLSLDDWDEKLTFTSMGPGFLSGGEVKTDRPFTFVRYETLKELKAHPTYGWASDSDSYPSSPQEQ
ncbi:hypothetical protein BGW39_001986 [Mortierella sp. 14UC]|nr:hypothetical protein BGW39_001986 [Mortierella sp. 14UC]